MSTNGDIIMKCENYLCIYESDGECILEEVKLDITGQCLECIYPNIDSELLNKLKRQTRKMIDNKQRIVKQLTNFLQNFEKIKKYLTFF